MATNRERGSVSLRCVTLSLLAVPGVCQDEGMPTMESLFGEPRSAAAERMIAEGAALRRGMFNNTLGGRGLYTIRPPPRENSGDRWAARGIAQGLAWLAANQEAEGCWKPDGRVRGTGYDDADNVPGLESAIASAALLAFLSDGHHPGGGRYAETVQRGLWWLCRHQLSDGSFAAPHDPRWVLHHAWSTLAVVEATAMSGNLRLRPHAVRALRRLLAAQEEHCWYLRVGRSWESGVATGWAAMAIWMGERCGFLDHGQTSTKGHTFDLERIRGTTGGVAAAPLITMLYGRRPEAGDVTALDQGFPALQPLADPVAAVLWSRAIIQVRSMRHEPSWGSALRCWRSGRTLAHGALENPPVDDPADAGHGTVAPGKEARSAGSRTLATAMSVLVLESCSTLTRQVR